MASAQTVAYKEITAAYDSTSYDTLIADSGTYDPCCNVMTWYNKFRRTDASSIYIYIRFHFNGTIVHNQYLDEDYDDWEIVERSNVVNVGPSSSHRLVISKSSLGNGRFDQLKMSAKYENEDQTK